jgi:hypothetical protein
MLVNQTCETLCRQTLSEDEINDFIWMIERDYKINWYIFVRTGPKHNKTIKKLILLIFE